MDNFENISGKIDREIYQYHKKADERLSHSVSVITADFNSDGMDEVIACADQHGIAMVFTGKRHFKH